MTAAAGRRAGLSVGLSARLCVRLSVGLGAGLSVGAAAAGSLCVIAALAAASEPTASTKLPAASTASAAPPRGWIDKIGGLKGWTRSDSEAALVFMDLAGLVCFDGKRRSLTEAGRAALATGPA